MKWPVFAIAAFVALVVQLSLRNVLQLEGLGGISPDIVASLAVFVALFAQRLSALWACWILGAMMDLAPAESVHDFQLIGKYTLGYVFGGVVVLQLRTMVFRRRAITLGFLTFVFLLGASVVVVAIQTLRSWYPGAADPNLRPLWELWWRFGVALYSGVVGMAVGWLLGTTQPIWGFQSPVPRRTAAR